MIEKFRFAADSPLEGSGFELLVPLLRKGLLRARPEIIESTFDRVNMEFTTAFSYHIWWL
jgi:hypothetical protein